MLLSSRSFVRRNPSRDAKSLYIFCEGVKREYQYFNYFRNIDSRINVDIYKLSPHENNSPAGLLQIAKDCIIPQHNNSTAKYSFEEGDEVWIVFDTDKDKLDSRQPQIDAIKKFCVSTSGWRYAQSNPCFEVWLYNHFCFIEPTINNRDSCSEWKQHLSKLQGGFDSKRHPLLLEDATIVAEKNYCEISGTPKAGCTEVFKLSQSILPLIKDKIDNELLRMDLK